MRSRTMLTTSPQELAQRWVVAAQLAHERTARRRTWPRSSSLRATIRSGSRP
ncbi:hypothetical protein [Streptomyces sp. NPDC005955]|uniref:hypothetical protein n=1 Tax=Streptomyces sp. NPDC005955 TaxID=3364738 RepID=UPI00367C74EB